MIQSSTGFHLFVAGIFSQSHWPRCLLQPWNHTDVHFWEDYLVGFYRINRFKGRMWGNSLIKKAVFSCFYWIIVDKSRKEAPNPVKHTILWFKMNVSPLREMLMSEFFKYLEILETNFLPSVAYRYYLIRPKDQSRPNFRHLSKSKYWDWKKPFLSLGRLKAGWIVLLMHMPIVRYSLHFWVLFYVRGGIRGPRWSISFQDLQILPLAQPDWLPTSAHRVLRIYLEILIPFNISY